MARVKCMFCGKDADPGWETCSTCDVEQAQLAFQEEADREVEDQYAREFATNDYNEQEEIRYLDNMLFGGH